MGFGIEHVYVACCVCRLPVSAVSIVSGVSGKPCNTAIKQPWAHPDSCYSPHTSHPHQQQCILTV